MYDKDDFDFTRKPHTDVLKTFACLVVPGYASIYFLLSFIWDVPAVKNVLGISAIITFILSIISGIRSRNYDGQIVITRKEDGKRIFSLELNKNPSELAEMKTVLFEVVEQPPDF